MDDDHALHTLRRLFSAVLHIVANDWLDLDDHVHLLRADRQVLDDQNLREQHILLRQYQEAVVDEHAHYWEQLAYEEYLERAIEQDIEENMWMCTDFSSYYDSDMGTGSD